LSWNTPSCRLGYPFLQTTFVKINVFPPLLPITTFAEESIFLNGGWNGSDRKIGAANSPRCMGRCGNDFRIGGLYKLRPVALPITSYNSSPDTIPAALIEFDAASCCNRNATLPSLRPQIVASELILTGGV
jgi:hypothetical protein